MHSLLDSTENFAVSRSWWISLHARPRRKYFRKKDTSPSNRTNQAAPDGGPRLARNATTVPGPLVSRRVLRSASSVASWPTKVHWPAAAAASSAAARAVSTTFPSSGPCSSSEGGSFSFDSSEGSIDRSLTVGSGSNWSASPASENALFIAVCGLSDAFESRPPR